MCDIQNLIEQLRAHVFNVCAARSITVGQLHDAYGVIPCEMYGEPSKVQVTKAFRELTLDRELMENISKVELAGYVVTRDHNSSVYRHYQLGLKEGLDLAKAYIMLRSIGDFQP